MNNTTQTPTTYLTFYSLLDALGFIMCVVVGAFTFGYAMSLYLFGA